MADDVPQDKGRHDIALRNGALALDGWQPHAHDGSASPPVDSGLAPTEARGSDIAALVSASGSQQDFDAAMTSLWGTTFYTNAVKTRCGEALRLSLRRLSGLT